MIKLKDILLREQEVSSKTTTKTLPSVSFDGVFSPNYITPNNKWKAVADQMVAEIEKYLADGYTLAEIKISINGGASPVPASNIYSGTTPPKHDFNGLLIKYNAKWVKPGESGGKNIEPDQGSVKGGNEGNEFLALNRALKLKALLIPYLTSKLGQPIPESSIVATGKTGVEKTVHATITPTVTKTDKTIIPPKYVIMYPWYQIGDTKNLVLVDVGPTGYGRNKAGRVSSNWANAAKSDPKVIFSGFQVITAAPQAANKGILPGCFIKLDNAYKYDGSFAYYKDYSSWLKDVQKMTQYASNDTQGGKLRLGGSTSNQKVNGITGAKGYVDTSGKSKYKAFAKFNFGSRKSFHLFKPEGDKAQVIADLFPPFEGKESKANTPAIMSNGKPSTLDVGKNSPMSKGPRQIPFYGSEVLRTAASYQS